MQDLFAKILRGAYYGVVLVKLTRLNLPIQRWSRHSRVLALQMLVHGRHIVTRHIRYGPLWNTFSFRELYCWRATITIRVSWLVVPRKKLITNVWLNYYIVCLSKLFFPPWQCVSFFVCVRVGKWDLTPLPLLTSIMQIMLVWLFITHHQIYWSC